MTAPTVRGTASNNSTSTTVTIAQAAFDVAPLAGDLLVAFCATSAADSSGSARFSNPIGWTPVTYCTSNGDAMGGISVFQKSWQASDGTYTFDTGGVNQACRAIVVALAGNARLDVVDVQNSTATATAQTAPSVTPSTTEDLLLCAWLSTGGGATVVSYTPASGMTELRDNGVNNTAGATVAMCVDSLTLSSVAATGTKTATASASRVYGSVTLSALPIGPTTGTGGLVYQLNRLAGTTGLGAAGAANAWAGTTGLELVGALNRKTNGNHPAASSPQLELNGICNALAGTTGKDAIGALATL